jgi:tetratricopeptide (TPR) repeat protein
VSARTRVRLVVALIAAVAAGVAVASGLLLDGEEHAAGQPPSLELGVAPDQPQARALVAAERAYEGGRTAEARRRFETILGTNPSSIPAAVGAAVASWPAGTVERLRDLARAHPNSALVRLHLGLALFAEGARKEAESEWLEAKEGEPDTPAALRAEDLLHPEMAPGRPFFFPSRDVVGADLAKLERRAESGEVTDLLAYGVALQRVGRPVSAQTAFDKALEGDPRSLEAQVAAAVGRFDKDAPEEAFSRLGPLARDHPEAGVVRFHLGLLLLWIRAVDEARRQLELAAEGEGFYAREAQRLLERLEEI